MKPDHAENVEYNGNDAHTPKFLCVSSACQDILRIEQGIQSDIFQKIQLI